MTTYQVNQPITLGCVIDLAKEGIGATAKNIIDVPAGFVVTDVVVEELATATSGTLTVKIGNDTLGKAVTVGGDSLAKTVLGAVIINAKDSAGTGTVEVPSHKFVASASKATITGSTTMSAGKARIALVGFVAIAPVPAAGATNTAIVDPMYA